MGEVEEMEDPTAGRVREGRRDEREEWRRGVRVKDEVVEDDEREARSEIRRKRNSDAARVQRYQGLAFETPTPSVHRRKRESQSEFSRGERKERKGRTINVLGVATERDRLSLLEPTLVQWVLGAERLNKLRQRRQDLLRRLSLSSTGRNLRPRALPPGVQDGKDDRNVELTRLAVRLVLMARELPLLRLLLRLNLSLLQVLRRTVGSISRTRPSSNRTLLLPMVDRNTKDLALGVPKAREDGSDRVRGGGVACGGDNVVGERGEAGAELKGGTEGEEGVEVEPGDFLPTASTSKENRSVRAQRREKRGRGGRKGKETRGTEEKKRVDAQVKALELPVPNDVFEVALQNARLLHPRCLSAPRVQRLLDISLLALIALLEEMDREGSEGKDARSRSVGLGTAPVTGEGLVVHCACGRVSVSEGEEGEDGEGNGPWYLTSPSPPFEKPPMTVSLCCMTARRRGESQL